MKTRTETRFMIRRRLPESVRWCLWGGLALAGVSLAIALLPLCSRCGSGSWMHAAVAGAGVVGYASLLYLLERNAANAVMAGILAAGGVHAALVGIMASSGQLCGVCLAAAILALANAAILIIRVKPSVRWIPRTFLPSFALVWIVAYAGLVQREAEARKHREAAARALAIRSDEAPGPRSGPRVLSVFEMDGCPYCREFRRSYEPRLAREFPDLTIVYRRAEDELWVRRAPTIALGDEVLFEGLPPECGDLVRKIARIREDRKTAWK